MLNSRKRYQTSKSQMQNLEFTYSNTDALERRRAELPSLVTTLSEMQASPRVILV